MENPITWEAAGFALAMMLSLAGVWWRIEAAITQVRKDADLKIQAAHAQGSLAASQLAEFRVHVAETYVSRDSVREMKDEIMDAVRDMKAGVDRLNSRIDNVVAPAPRSRAAS